MLKPRSILLFLGLLAVAAYAQSGKESPEPAKPEPREPSRDADTQQRRAMLRASLRAQPEFAIAREAPVPATRLLSDQERAELRQQLRQQ